MFLTRRRSFAALSLIAAAYGCGGGSNNTTQATGTGGAQATSSSASTSGGGNTVSSTGTNMASSSTGFMMAVGDPCRGTPLPTDQHFVPGGMCARLVAENVGGIRQITF